MYFKRDGVKEVGNLGKKRALPMRNRKIQRQETLIYSPTIKETKSKGVDEGLCWGG